MRLTVNGQPDTVVDHANATVAAFLAVRGLTPEHVVVERNGVIVPRERFAEEQLADGDVLEVVTFVGGG